MTNEERRTSVDLWFTHPSETFDMLGEVFPEGHYEPNAIVPGYFTMKFGNVSISWHREK